MQTNHFNELNCSIYFFTNNIHQIIEPGNQSGETGKEEKKWKLCKTWLRKGKDTKKNSTKWLSHQKEVAAAAAEVNATRSAIDDESERDSITGFNHQRAASRNDRTVCKVVAKAIIA